MSPTDSSSFLPATFFRVLKSLGGYGKLRPCLATGGPLGLLTEDPGGGELRRSITEDFDRERSSGSDPIRQPDSGRDSSVRMNAALRRWSVEYEQGVWYTTPATLVDAPPAAAHPVAVVPEDRTSGPPFSARVGDGPLQSPTNRAAEAQQSSETTYADKEMNRTYYSATALDEPPPFHHATTEAPEDSSGTTFGEREGSEARSESQEQNTTQATPLEFPDDYYEILQISRNADMDTIHRVYRIMALRYHPDNEKTGSLERFLLLKRAYQVLSNPAQRAAYDALHQGMAARPLPQFEERQFVYGIEGEVNRRLGVLSLLYNRRRMNEGSAGMSVLDMENRMSFPREYLNFTLWYLRSKNYIVLQENSDYALTADGVDYVEGNSSTNHIIRQLLTTGCSHEGDCTG